MELYAYERRRWLVDQARQVGRIDVAGGRTTNLVIRLSTRAKAALAKQPSLRANLTVTLKGGGEKRVLVTLKR